MFLLFFLLSRCAFICRTLESPWLESLEFRRLKADFILHYNIRCNLTCLAFSRFRRVHVSKHWTQRNSSQAFATSNKTNVRHESLFLRMSRAFRILHSKISYVLPKKIYITGSSHRLELKDAKLLEAKSSNLLMKRFDVMGQVSLCSANLNRRRWLLILKMDSPRFVLFYFKIVGRTPLKMANCAYVRQIGNLPTFFSIKSRNICYWRYQEMK